MPSLGVPAGAVGVLVRLADPAAATVLRPGSRVDLLPGPVGGATLRDILVLAVVAGGLFDEPGAAALLVAVPADHIPAGRVPAGPDATRVTYEVIVRTG